MGKAVRILIPSGCNFIFADFKTPRCQFSTKLPKMSDLCYLGKTRILESSQCLDLGTWFVLDASQLRGGSLIRSDVLSAGYFFV